MSFESYSDCILQSYILHPKAAEILKRKHEILTEVSKFHNYNPDTILYVGFNPAILIDKTKHIFVTLHSKKAIEFLTAEGIKFTDIPFDQLAKFKKNFDAVIALDEFFTFSKNDQSQKELVNLICNITKEYIITTCRDYKNQEYKDREFSSPAIIRHNNSKTIYLEFHDHDLQDRNTWQSEVFEIQNNQLNTIGPFDRRALFFKQLAKFTADNNAVDFIVHKNLMYKSIIKKNYEHVISIRFENNES